MSEQKNDDSKSSEEITEGEKANLKGDYKNVVLLVLLYMLQGIPSGLCSAIPILLQNRGVTYAQQAIFTFVFYPFSMKVLWSPLVDSIYIKRIGRRKTWIIPTQLLIGIFFLFFAGHVNEWLGDGEENPPHVLTLTVVFFSIRMFAATQDISVDGWALCLLKKRNIGHVATCEAFGITAGWSISYVLLLVLESKEFCNAFIFSEPRSEGLITLSGFMRFWGVFYLIATLLFTFKREDPENEEKLREHPDYGVKKAYPTLWKVLCLKPIIKYSIFMLTVKVSFEACDSVTSLKLVEYGFPKDKIALLAVPLLPLQIMIPFFVSKFITGSRPMSFYIKAFRVRLLMSIIVILIVFSTPKMISKNNIPLYYYVGLVAVYLLYQIPLRCMVIAEIAFFARISDPLIGGTYMTLLNTICNLGSKWATTVGLWLIDIVTWKDCLPIHEINTTFISSSPGILIDNHCRNKEEKEICLKNGGFCDMKVDGYIVKGIFCLIYGIVWHRFGARLINYLQKLPLSEWHVLAKDVENQESIQLREKE